MQQRANGGHATSYIYHYYYTKWSTALEPSALGTRHSTIRTADGHAGDEEGDKQITTS